MSKEQSHDKEKATRKGRFSEEKVEQELKRTNSMHRAFSQKDRSAWLLFLLLCKDVQPPVVAVVNFIAFSVCARSADGHRIFPSSSSSPSSLYYDGWGGTFKWEMRNPIPSFTLISISSSSFGLLQFATTTTENKLYSQKEIHFILVSFSFYFILFHFLFECRFYLHAPILLCWHLPWPLNTSARTLWCFVRF